MAEKAGSSSGSVLDRIRGFGHRVRKGVADTFTRIGNNIESIILYSRLKDVYKLFDVAMPFISAELAHRFIKTKQGRFAGELIEQAEELEQKVRDLEKQAYGFGVVEPGQDVAGVRTIDQRLDRLESHMYASSGKLHESVELRDTISDLRNQAKDLYKQADIKSGKIMDTVFGGFMGLISYFSNWVDKRGVTNTYNTVLTEELGITGRRPEFKDARESTNPIIKKAADYYHGKSIFRHLTDFAAGIRFLPGEKTQEASGMRAVQGVKAGFFAWYFLERFTGSHYAAMNIWNRTEGVALPTNRALNKGTNPGEPVKLGDIIDLYENYQNEQDLGKSYTTDEKLTRIVFQQMAKYLNYHYIRNLQDPKDNFGAEGTEFTFAKLVEFVGRGGIDIDNSLKTSALLEIAARKDVPAFLEAKSRMEGLSGSDFPKIEAIAKEYLGEAWPPGYVETRIRPDVIVKYAKNLSMLPSAHTHAINIQIDDGDEVEMAHAIVSNNTFTEMQQRFPRVGNDFVMSKEQATSLVGDLDAAQKLYAEKLRQDISDARQQMRDNGESASGGVTVTENAGLIAQAQELNQPDRGAPQAG